MGNNTVENVIGLKTNLYNKMECNCEYCFKHFVNKSTLKIHQNTAKYCLKLQGKTITKTIDNKIDYICGTCSKQTARKEAHDKHVVWCIDTLHGQMIKKLRNDIGEIRDDSDAMIARMQDKIDSQEAKISSMEQSLTDMNVLQAKLEIYRTLSDNKQYCLEDISKYHNESAIEIEIKESDSDEETESCYLKTLNIGDGYELEYREKDSLFNVTDLCKAGGKQFKAWNCLDETTSFIQALSSSMIESTGDLIKYESGTNDEIATWVHPQVAINIAQWISPQFDVKVSGWVYEAIISGKVTASKMLKQTRDKNKDHIRRIKYLEKTYLKKQPRMRIIDKNVIYILTTINLKKERRYILGKTTDLTNRLSTYNKTDEHQIVYCQPCSTDAIMSLLEPIVFKKLSNHREQPNRERFVLPKNKDISYFIDTIKECAKFLDP
jgi:hypothetical protein